MPESDDDELRPRSAEEIAQRVLALIAVVDRAHNENSDRLNAWISKNGIREYFSPEELEFYESSEPTDQDITNFSWRAEAMVPLLWSIGELDELPPLNEQLDWSLIPNLSQILKNPAQFVQDAERRPVEEIEEAEAFLYHQHWRVRDAELFEKPMPVELDPGIVYERRYAASWIVGWGRDEGWDNVPTDT